MIHWPAEDIQRVGFRKWYERQLLASHAHMALGFLAAIAVTGSIEAFRSEGADTRLFALFVVLCTAIGAWALKRYSFLLGRAENLANQASCPACGEYGRFRVVAASASADGLDVRCRRCTRGWVITGLG
ncbi:MAG: hypothetical protein HY854_00565 [Burkholderiales bacterium]|nr:hypothetical protein [Burkholderiales bacterium]